MPRTKLIDGVRYNLTTEEEAIRDAEEKAWSDKAFDRAILKLRIKRNRLLAETDWDFNEFLRRDLRRYLGDE